MAEVLFFLILSLVFISLNVFPPIIRTSGISRDIDLNAVWDPKKVDLNAPLVDDEVTDEGTFNSGIDAGPGNNSVRFKKASVEWRPFVPNKTSDFAKRMMYDLEAYQQANNRSNTWNVSSIEQEDALLLCTRAWSTLMIKDFKYADYGKQECVDASKRSIGSAGVQYVCHHHYFDDPKIYFLDLIRCNCRYVAFGSTRAVKNSKYYFLLHRVKEKQYLIYSPIDPNFKSSSKRAYIHVVDFFIDS